jgi:CRP-like cAMP-binding protein/small-conductance mechanosensitive channel
LFESLTPLSTGSAALVITVVVLGLLVNRFARERRRYLRHCVLLTLAHLLLAGVALGWRSAGGAPPIALERASEVIALLAWAAAASIATFHLTLPALRVRVTSILSDVGAGAAYLVALFVGLRRAGFDPTAVLTTSAVVTAVLALSLQATLGNVIGGIALQMDDTIRVGDWIQLENGRQGRVRQIRWRHTVLETRDWDTWIVPNATLLGAQILILGKRENEPLQHRMWVHFQVDFRFPPSEVIEVVESALGGAKIPGVAETPRANCVCMDLARDGRDSFALYAVRYWLTDLARDDPTSSLVRERVFSALRRASIPLAIPAAHLWVENDSEKRRRRKRERDLQKRIQALATVEFLQSLDPSELQFVAEKLTEAPFAEGEVITRQGAVAHFLYIVVRGTVEVRLDGPNEGCRVATITAPAFFGERGLMTGEPRGATVVALSDVECYRLDKESFQKVLEDRPSLAVLISQAFAEREVELEAAREGLDAGAKSARVVHQKTELLTRIQSFFGLDGDRDSRAP